MKYLEPDGDEGGDRRHDREDLVGDGSRAVGEPHGEADQRVAERAKRDGLDEAEARRRFGYADGRRTHLASAELVLAAEVNDQHRAECADEVAGVDEPSCRAAGSSKRGGSPTP